MQKAAQRLENAQLLEQSQSPYFAPPQNKQLGTGAEESTSPCRMSLAPLVADKQNCFTEGISPCTGFSTHRKYETEVNIQQRISFTFSVRASHFMSYSSLRSVMKRVAFSVRAHCMHHIIRCTTSVRYAF